MEREDDDPILRIQQIYAKLGLVNPAAFQQQLFDAVKHAADPARADAQVRPWVPVGPRNLGGRIVALAQHPKNPSILYAGSGFGGLWKSTDSGDTWIPLENFSPPDGVRLALPIGAIAIAPKDPNIIYVGTGQPALAIDGGDFNFPGFGLYRSTDEGGTFVQIDSVETGAIKATRFERIVVDPSEPGHCWIACPKGLWRREPNGKIIQDVIDAGDAGPANSQIVTDIVIDFKDSVFYTAYAALRGKGIYRADFSVSENNFVKWFKLDKGIQEKDFNRIKLALCKSKPTELYSVFGLKNGAASRVYHSANKGDKWERTAALPADSGRQATYSLILEVHPERPELVFTGSLDLFRSQNSGKRWEKILDFANYDAGDRAQHADQHALLFDAGREGTIWLGNGGGISRSRDLGSSWRRRSYGILALHTSEITVHPTLPWVTAAGFQDSGCWVGLGGQTWFHLSGGDGGATAFNPSDLTRIITTTPGWNGTGQRHPLGLLECEISNVEEPPGLNRSTRFKSPLPDVEVSSQSPGVIKKYRSNPSPLKNGFASENTAPFTGVMEHHPAKANHFLVGRKGALYLTVNGTFFQKQQAGPFAGEDPEVTAVAYAPTAPDTDLWMGTSQGEIFMTANGGELWRNVTPQDLKDAIAGDKPGTSTKRVVTDIAIHPKREDMVVVTLAVFELSSTTGRVYMSGDKGTTWKEMSGRVDPPFGSRSLSADELNPLPAMCVVFDPDAPVVNGPQPIFVGTVAGVYVIRNVLPPSAIFPEPAAPVWRTFNSKLPLSLIYDLAPVLVRDAANQVVRTALRCGTHGRGIWECDLAGAPAVQLFIRNTPISDGRIYTGPAAVANDPRLVPATPLSFDKGFDLRVAKPPLEEVESTIDGVEFDEILTNAVPVAGLKNQVYVQVHTNGHVEDVGDVQVLLYFANPQLAAPDLASNFWDTFPGDPPAGAWRKGATGIVRGLGAGQPVVARLEWIPPLDLRPTVALLAVCTRPPAGPGDTNADDLKAASPPVLMDPDNPTSLVRTERRAALRITALEFSRPSVFVRDGNNDVGVAGSVAWGGHTPDIIVRQSPEADPETAFADLGDTRPEDVVIGNATNHIYIRVSNRMDVEVSADVELYQAPHDTIDKPNTWVQIQNKVTVNAIPPKSSKLTSDFQLSNPPDPAPNIIYKAMFFVAVVYPLGTPSPSRSQITDLETFWKLMIQGIGSNTDVSAACRGLRWKPQP
jgi:photosystem II stability/assembly factor-like uncharacterized protein